MRIAILHNSFNKIGGAEFVANQQYDQLIKLGFEVQVFSGDICGLEPWSPSQSKLERLRRHFLDLFGMRLNELIKGIDEFNPDLIHIHNWVGLRSNTLSFLSTVYPVAHTVHDYSILDPSTLLKQNYNVCTRTILRWRTLLLLKRFHKICFIFPSERTQKYFQNYFGLLPSKQIIQPFDLQFNFMENGNRSKNTKVLGYLGQIEPHKGILDFTERFVTAGNPSLSLIIAGKGSDERFLFENFNDSNVTFLGWLDQTKISFFLNNISWLVFPSIWPENFSIACCQALKLGLPIIVDERSKPPFALDGALLTYGPNSKYLSIEEVLDFVNGCTDEEYIDFSSSATASIKNFTTPIDWNALHSKVLEDFCES